MLETVVTFILAGIVGFAIIMYVVLDGFDLGIGILFPWVDNEHHRNIMMSTILPVWDGNETWLVLGGATLYAAFPVVYSTILPTLYLPVILMLAALIFRGVSFEFLHSAYRSRHLWVFCFSIGSTVAAFCQGVVLGTFVQGYTYESGALITSNYQWLTPFSMLTGIAVVFGYALLGSTWLIAKTSNDLQRTMFHRAKVLLIFVAIFMILASLWTPLIDPGITQRWFSFPNFYYLSILPLITVFVFFTTWKALQSRFDFAPFILSICIFLLAYVGFAISVWPYVIPRAVTVWQAAAPFKSQVFILVGLVILLPVLIGYTAYSYVVFRGKVTDPHHGPHY